MLLLERTQADRSYSSGRTRGGALYSRKSALFPASTNGTLRKQLSMDASWFAFAPRGRKRDVQMEGVSSATEGSRRGARRLPGIHKWWRRRGIEPLVQKKTHPDLYKLSRRLCLVRRTSTDGVTGGPADLVLGPPYRRRENRTSASRRRTLPVEERR